MPSPAHKSQKFLFSGKFLLQKQEIDKKMEQFLNVLITDQHRVITNENELETIMEQIKSTHTDHRELEGIEHLLQFITDILELSTTKDCHINPVGRAMESLKKSTPNFDALTKTIYDISCKISCKCVEGDREEEPTLELFKMLSTCSWVSKVVLVMSAFAVTYGGFFVLEGANKSEPLRKLRCLTTAMVDVTKCINNIRYLPADANPPDQSVVQIAVYWTIRSVICCVPHFFGFLSLGHEYTPSESQDEDLDKLSEKLNEKHIHLKEVLDRHQEHIDSVIKSKQKKISVDYQMLEELFKKTQVDTTEILNALTKDGLNPLPEISTEQQVGVEVTVKKNVLILVSEVDFFQEIGILIDIYEKSVKQSRKAFEVQCLTVGELKKSREVNFKQLMLHMKWKWVHHESTSAVAQYVNKVWRFNKKPILVALNEQGRVVNTNAFTMIKIKGRIDQSVFTLVEKKDIRSQMTWRVQLFLQTIEEHRSKLKWVNIVLFFLLLLFLRKSNNCCPCPLLE